MNYLLDTCVFSELVKTDPSPNVLAQWNSKLAPEEREAIEAFLALPPDKRKLFGQLMKACGK